jgi:hypothetical protein
MDEGKAVDDITAEDVEWLVGDIEAPAVVSFVEAYARNAGLAPRAAWDRLAPFIAESFARPRGLPC